MQESQTPQGSGVGRWGEPTPCGSSAPGQDAGDSGFPDAAVAGEDVAVRDPVLRKGIQQSARNVILPGDVGKALRTIFASQNLVTHPKNYPRVSALILFQALGWIVSFRG